MDVVGEASNGVAAVRLVVELAPDLVFIDVIMPELSGIDATRQILAALAGVKVIAVSMHGDEAFVDGMFAAGASAYVLKDKAFDDVIAALHSVTDGGTYRSAGLS